MRETRQHEVTPEPENVWHAVNLRPDIYIEKRGSARVAYNPSRWGKETADELFRLPQIVRRLSGSSSRSAGRPTVWHWHPDHIHHSGFVVRQFVHGGALGGLLGTWFYGTGRMEHEMYASLYAADHELPTCRAVALRTERVAGPFYAGYLLTEHIPHSFNLLQLCQRIREGSRVTATWKRHIAGLVADAIGRLHDGGLEHTDLNLQNVLIQHPWDDPRAYIIDLDKARLHHRVPLENRLDNLVRLDRSVVKWQSSRTVINLPDRIRVLKRYMARYDGWDISGKYMLRQKKSRHLRHVLSRQ